MPKEVYVKRVFHKSHVFCGIPGLISGKTNSIGQFQLVHAPAALGGNEVHRAQCSCIGCDWLRHIPAVEVLIFAGQDNLSEFQAAVGLRFGFGEKIAAVGNVAAPVAIDGKDRIVRAFLIKAVLAVCNFLYALV